MDLSSGTVIDDYVVVDALGRGSFGTVYSAYDPALDRKLALKLAHAATDPAPDDPVFAKARTLAGLSHENLVAVHDTGVYRRHAWIATEFVAGPRLLAWFAADAPRWPAIVDALCSAGEGLGAAHRGGLIHGDLKPDNVAVTAGRVQLLDLAVAGTNFTRRYAAPERLRGEPPDATADQYAFFATLWHALFGRPPFDADSDEGLIAAIDDGRPQRHGSSRGVSAAVQRACERGLAAEPSARFADMAAAVAELRAARGRARTRTVLVVGGAAGVLGLGGAVLFEADERRRVARCEARGAAITEVWGDPQRAAVRKSLLATGVNFAASTADLVEERLDTYATQWRANRTEACLDAEVRGRWDTETHGRAEWCLDDRRVQLSALVSAFRNTERETLGRAIPAAAGLPSPASCRDPATLARRQAVPPLNRRLPVREVEAQLAAAAAMGRAGQTERALEVARSARARAQLLQWDPVTARALDLEASFFHELGDFRRALDLNRAAYELAYRAGAWAVAATAAAHLTSTVGRIRPRPGRSKAWADHAGVALALAGDEVGTRAAVRANSLGSALLRAGELHDAEPALRRAVELRSDALGERHPRVGQSLSNLGLLLAQMGQLDEAQEVLARSHAINREALGPDHPKVAASLTNLAMAYSKQKHYAKAYELDSEALAIQEAALGAEHPLVARRLLNLSYLASMLTEYDRAEAYLTRAINIVDKTAGPDSSDAAIAHYQLATLHRQTGEELEARRQFRQALAIFEAEGRSGRRNAATVLEHIGGSLRRTGAHAEGLAHYQRVLAIRRELLGPDHHEVGTCLSNVAAAKLATNDLAGASADVKSALAIIEKTVGPNHTDIASALQVKAEVDRRSGRMQEAADAGARAIAIMEGAHGSTHPFVASALLSAAETEVAREQHDAAVVLLQRAITIFDAHRGAQANENSCRWLMAQELVATGGDVSAARAQAKAALEGFRASGQQAEVEALVEFLRSHPEEAP